MTPHFPSAASQSNLKQKGQKPTVFRSGDDEILRQMDRGYTAQRYRDLCARLRAAMPGCGLSADAIVGFPGETEAQFQRTVELVEDKEKGSCLKETGGCQLEVFLDPQMIIIWWS